MNISTVIQNITNRGKAVSLLNLGLMIVIALMLSGCLAHSPQRHGNPHYDHHDTPRAEVIFNYHYYPDVHVYYDTHRRLYHYHDKYRGWITVRILPGYIHLGGHRHHIVNSKHNKPWKLKHRNKRPHSHVAPSRHRPNNDQHRPHNDQHRPNSGQGHSQQRQNQNPHYRSVPKPVQKPNHDEQRRWRQKKQPGALTPRQTVPQKHLKKEQKFIKQKEKDNQNNDDRKKKTNQLKKRYE